MKDNITRSINNSCPQLQLWGVKKRIANGKKRIGIDLSVEQVRLDATTISGHHLISEGGLFQFGHSKDDPSLPQVKLMMGMIDPLGM
uniref:Uncharacterized protein n=1 Tax=Nostoc flagelliforme str. Sunitezuoqi TaxID=676037 RepID=E7DQ74_9NOSO|nr:hypothetical protein Nfla_7604 [Nostoc flagelliforme str. Sunitezuoqi]